MIISDSEKVFSLRILTSGRTDCDYIRCRPQQGLVKNVPLSQTNETADATSSFEHA